MTLSGYFVAIFVTLTSVSCVVSHDRDWKASADDQVNQLGYRNWIVVAEASFPAHSRSGVRQITADAEVPEVVDYVLNALERTQHVRPRIYLTRELRAVENDFAPGIDDRVFDALFAQHCAGDIDGITLGNSAKVQLHGRVD